MGAQQVGVLSDNVIKTLNLSFTSGQPIYLGESNVAHMMRRHPNDYAKYGQCIQQILSNPDYVGQSPSDDSIEYVKEFRMDNEYVKVAVRVSAGGTLFARSLYVLNNNRTNNFIKKGTLKRI